MKKIYTLIIGSLAAVASYAQCTPNPALFGAANNTNYSIIPDTVTNLPVAYVGTGYNTDLQFHIKPDTSNSFGTFPITQVQIDSVIGLAPNFSYLPNPSNGTFTTPNANPPGTGYGCVAVLGTAAAGEELGGPNSDGVYPITVYYTATVVIFNTPQQFPATVTGYKLVILPAAGVQSYDAAVFSIANNTPNPADEQTEFKLNVPSAGNASMTLYNCIGAEIRHENFSVAKGGNHYILQTADLAEGVYLCSFRMGSNVITRRITVSH
ncbi:MAG TPA: T9SS type A sorting domain-containing protein [Bacteroidia bacterium]|jgi:hypothetical protein|nr:T9SS type A sorting domain-containing protein [Bacteroidia bacterium]